MDFDFKGFENAIKNNYSIGGHCYGVIFKTTANFVARLEKNINNEIHGWVYPELHIQKNEFLEFRYENNAYLRNTRNEYIMIDPSILLVKCVPFAKINNDVRWSNKLNLDQILEQKLYTEYDIPCTEVKHL